MFSRKTKKDSVSLSDEDLAIFKEAGLPVPRKKKVPLTDVVNARTMAAVKRFEVEREAKKKESAELEIEKQQLTQELATLKDVEDKIRGEVLERTEMSQLRVDITQPTMDMVGRLESHRAGTYLKSAVISNKAPPQRELNLSRLRTFKALNEFSRLTLDDIEPFDLIGDFCSIPITSAISPEYLATAQPYVLVSDIFLHYIPLDTFFSTAYTVDVFINDFRKTENVAVRHFTLSNTGGYNILFSLDFCVRTVDLKHIVLTISTSMASFKKSIAWASVKTNIALTFMDFPIKSNMQDTMGVLHLSDSDLTEYISDPRHSDGVITPESLRLLRLSHLRGDIEKVNQNVEDRKEVNQAKTVFTPHDGAVEVGDLMRSLRAKALEEERVKSGVVITDEKPKPRSDGEPISFQPKSAMRKKSPSRAKSPPPPSVSSVDDEELVPGDSLSDISSTKTIDLPRNPSKTSEKLVDSGF